MKKIFLLVFICFMTATTVSAQDGPVRQVITTSTSDAELKSIKESLAEQGIILKIKSIHRNKAGIDRIALVVKSPQGKVIYYADDFSEVIIERNENLCIGVRSVPARS